MKTKHLFNQKYNHIFEISMYVPLIVLFDR